MTLYQIRSHNLEFENDFFSNIKKCVRVKSNTLNFLEREKRCGSLELSASDFNRAHLKLPNVHIVHWVVFVLVVIIVLVLVVGEIVVECRPD